MNNFIISAEQAKKITVNSPKYSMQADNSKLKTIMQNVKKYASNGYFSFIYQSHISYNMAKCLIEQGYVLGKEKEPNEYTALTLDDFKLGRNYGIKICWGSRYEVFEDEND